MDEIKKWILKADNDLKAAEIMLFEKEPVTDVICFHSQQAVEKYLKAYLVIKKIEFRKTHDIAELLKLCMSRDRDFEVLNDKGIIKLSVYATELRYPEYFYIPTVEEAKEAIEKAKFVKEFVMKKME
ncbi:MAG TPA: HEPN domain-containing protein [Elusimicrobiales bacterium]|nr:HEPN domain-containing protein [Elusimicrobiales bacterium]HPO95557.1 HEPN domain-containing protein [Elusimicrobiales bacterium]